MRIFNSLIQNVFIKFIKMFINGFIFDGHYNTRCNFFDSENQKKNKNKLRSNR